MALIRVRRNTKKSPADVSIDNDKSVNTFEKLQRHHIVTYFQAKIQIKIIIIINNIKKQTQGLAYMCQEVLAKLQNDYIQAPEQLQPWAVGYLCNGDFPHLFGQLV